MTNIRVQIWHRLCCQSVICHLCSFVNKQVHGQMAAAICGTPG